MSSRSDHEFLADILEAIRRATAYIGELSYIVKDELPTVALQIQQIHNRID